MKHIVAQHVGVAAALFLIGCTSHSGAAIPGDDASPDSPACTQYASFAACNVPTLAPFWRYDSSRSCLDGPTEAEGACVSSIYCDGQRSASLVGSCAVSSDGEVVLAVTTGDEYVAGNGWVASYYPDYGPEPPPADRFFANDGGTLAPSSCLLACGAILCDGGVNPFLSVGLGGVSCEAGVGTAAPLDSDP